MSATSSRKATAISWATALISQRGWRDRQARRDLSSKQAYWQVKGRLDLKVTDLGAITLKNIAEPVRAYSLEVDQLTEAKPTPIAPERPIPPRLSIVVLPFANIGGDPEQEYFVDGVTESLTTDLSRLHGAFVIGHSTAFAYKGKATDLRQIGATSTCATRSKAACSPPSAGLEARPPSSSAYKSFKASTRGLSSVLAAK
jgi:hypothetical protein